MVNAISEWLHRVSKGWAALGALAIFVLFTVLVLPGQSRQAEMSSADAGSPDTSFWYAPADLYRMAEAYGAEGRQAYIHARLTFDAVWPVVYALFLTTAISWLYRRAFPQGSLWRRANLAPLLGIALDYLENLSTMLVMWLYPARTPVVDTLAPIFTAFKWVFVGGSMILLLIGASALLWQAIRGQARTRRKLGEG